MHLGISLTSENWGCLRNPLHRGHNPLRLIGAILGCSRSQAQLLLNQFGAPDPESLEDAIAALDDLGAAQAIPRQAPQMPTDALKPITRSGTAARFWRYLEGRGFDDVGSLVKRYSLTCAVLGRWKDRVIIPFHQQGKLIGWTGRAIGPVTNAPRYLSSGPEVKGTVFNEDGLTGGRILFIVEGPFDALKLDYYGRTLDAHATCVFGTSMTTEQIIILNNVSHRYERVVLLFDENAIEPSFIASDWLHNTPIFGLLPSGVKDPGNLTKEQVCDLMEHVR